MDELVLAVIYLIIFGGIGYYSYICIKAEGIFWVPKAILQSFMFICFFYGIWNLSNWFGFFMYSGSSVIGQLIRMGIVISCYFAIFGILSLPFYSLIKKIQKKSIETFDECEPLIIKQIIYF